MHESSLIPATWNVPAEIIDRLGKQVGRQRTMVAEKHLLIILHAPPSPEDMYRKGRFFWREPDSNWHSSELKGGDRKSTRLNSSHRMPYRMPSSA